MKNLFKFNRVFSVLLLSSLFVANVAAWEFPWTDAPVAPVVVPTKMERVGAALSGLKDSAVSGTSYAWGSVARDPRVTGKVFLGKIKDNPKTSAAIVIGALAVAGGIYAYKKYFKKPVVTGSEAAPAAVVSGPGLVSRALTSVGAATSKYVTAPSVSQWRTWIRLNNYAEMITKLEDGSFIADDTLLRLCSSYLIKETRCSTNAANKQAVITALKALVAKSASVTAAA